MEAVEIVLVVTVGAMKIRGSNGAMVFGWMVLGKIIGAVEGAFAPIDVVLALANTVADPVEAHVDGFGAFLFYRIGNDTSGGAVVGLDGGGWLGMAHFFKGGSDGACFFAVVEKGT